MDIGNIISVNLKREAIDLGLCKEWQNAWQENSTMQELINKYLRGIDFCLQRHWPSNDFIESHFPQDLLTENGILCNGTHSFLNPPSPCVILGDSHAVIRINGDNGARIYVNDNSQVEVKVKSAEKVIIEVRGHASLVVDPDFDYKCDISVYDYSDTSKVFVPDGVKYKSETDYLI